MNFLKQRYQELDKLRYSEENIAELFSILNKIITFLQEKDPDRITNKPLHFVLLTKEREFKRFYYEELKSIPEKVFESARTNLMSDLRHYCTIYWNWLEDSPGSK
jgi:hypothetical protein